MKQCARGREGHLIDIVIGRTDHAVNSVSWAKGLMQTLCDQLNDFTNGAVAARGREDDPSSCPCLGMRILDDNPTPDSL
jgi:hypothetical protein